MEEDVKAIIDGIKDGTIDCIVTDNVPVSEEEKAMGLGVTMPGIVGFETTLCSALSYLIDNGSITYKDLVKLLSYNPAKILGLEDLGTIEIGKKADIVVFHKKQKIFLKSR